jgi:acyl-CoA reductase-like NAD-dependent aldehyde dehydrogenase
MDAQAPSTPGTPLNLSMPPSSRQEIDEALARLAENKALWASVPPADLVALLDTLRRDFAASGEDWAQRSAMAKGVMDATVGAGEEWLFVGVISRMLRLLQQTLGDIAQGKSPQLPGPFTVNERNHVVAPVFPGSTLDKFSLQGITAEVWMRAGDSIDETQMAQASAYQSKRGEGRVSLVLGAGNVSALVPGDFLHKLFVERSVVILKLNEVNEYLGPILARGFRALVERGCLQIVYGGVDQGQYLCNHPLVDDIHMTGSDRTFNAIVFGPGEEGSRNRAANTPILHKPVTAELGNISPVIVVPGPWTEKDIERQGIKLASWLTANAGFNCLTPRLFIQQRQWAQREALNEALRSALGQTPTRPAYYPGAEALHARFVEAHPDAWQSDNTNADALPWTYITDVDAGNPDDIVFGVEPFCSLMSETALDVADTSEFIAEAVRFANERVWGTLVATLVVHPNSAQDPALAAAIEVAIAELSYGTVTVNHFAGLGYALASAPWGGAPGQPIQNIQSGIGFVNNPYMFEHPIKSVVRGPFLQSPDINAPDFSKFEQFGRNFAALQADPGYGKLARLVWTVMTG